jgi:hypothetical protein
VFKRIHIILIPGNSGPVKQYRMCWVLPVFIGLLALSWMGFCGWVLVDYQFTRQKVLRLAQLEMENERGKREFLRFAESIDQIRERISEHRDLDQKIQDATKLDPGEDFSRYKGMGGPDPEFSLSRLPTPKTNRKMVSSLYRALDALNSEIGIGKRTKARLHDLLERREEVLTLVSTTQAHRRATHIGVRLQNLSVQRQKGIPPWDRSRHEDGHPHPRPGRRPGGKRRMEIRVWKDGDHRPRIRPGHEVCPSP